MVGTHVPPSSRFKRLCPNSRKTEAPKKEGNLGSRQVINDSTSQRAKPSCPLGSHGIDDQAPVAFAVEQTYAVALREYTQTRESVKSGMCVVPRQMTGISRLTPAHPCSSTFPVLQRLNKRCRCRRSPCDLGQLLWQPRDRQIRSTTHRRLTTLHGSLTATG